MQDAALVALAVAGARLWMLWALAHAARRLDARFATCAALAFAAFALAFAAFAFVARFRGFVVNL